MRSSLRAARAGSVGVQMVCSSSQQQQSKDGWQWLMERMQMVVGDQRASWQRQMTRGGTLTSAMGMAWWYTGLKPTECKDDALQLWRQVESDPVQVPGFPVHGVHFAMEEFTWSGLQSGEHLKACPPSKAGRMFMRSVNIIGAGVLGMTQSGDREFELSERDVLVDPCSVMTVRNFIQRKRDGTAIAFVRGPCKAWDLPMAIYKSIKIPGAKDTLSEAWEFPGQVRDKIQAEGDAAFFRYVYHNGDWANVVHCPGWCFNPDEIRKGHGTAVNANHDDAVVLLSSCYKNIFKEIAAARKMVMLEKVYMAPLSGGALVKNSHLAHDFPMITYHAMASAYDQLGDADKQQIEQMSFHLCIWEVRQQAPYEHSLTRFVQNSQ